MAYLDAPAEHPTNLRPNVYDRSCRHCGGLVPANTGVAFLLWDDHTAKNKWHAAHGSQTELDGCIGVLLSGDKTLPAATGPVAKAQLEAKAAEEETLERLLTAPSLTPPDAEAMQAFIATAMAAQLQDVVSLTTEAFNATVPELVSTLLASARPVTITVNNAPPVTVKRKHKALEDVLLMVAAGTSPFLVGPAGSGKTTLAQQIATCLQRPFYMASRVSSEYKLTGFIDATGKVVRTPFREAYEHGGVFLFDEVDASDPDALTAFNAALAGQLADFPDAVVQRHPDFFAIAAGNTFGRGADRQYVGRNQLDAATLDRFQTYEVDYDEELERELAGNAEWTAYVQRVRKAIEAEKVRHVVSPRASISGAKLLAAGMERSKVEETCIWKGLDTTNRARVESAMARSN